MLPTTSVQRRKDELPNSQTNAKLRQRNIQIQAMHSMDRVTDEDEDVAKDKISKRVNLNSVHFDSDDDTVKQHRDDHEDDVFETYLVVTFANTIGHKALHWIVDKIRSKRSHGGAELLIRMEPQSE